MANLISLYLRGRMASRPDSFSNTVFNEELTDEARKNAKELFLKLQKELLRI